MEPDRFDDVTAHYEVEPEPGPSYRRRSERGAMAFVAAWIATSALAAGALALTGSDAEKAPVAPATAKPASSEAYFHHAGDRDRECEERKAAKRRARSASGLQY